MANNFFKHNDKVYSENLNDSILVSNAFDWTVEVSLPNDTGSVFPNSSTVVKAKVADVNINPNSNLSIGETVSNDSGSNQEYRLTVYPDFNRFGGFKSISLDADSGVTFYIANKGGTTPIANNLDYTNLSNVPELKVLKEYDIVLTIPNGKSVSGLEFVFQSSSADVSGTIDQSNVTGLEDTLTEQEGRLSTLEEVNSDIYYYNLMSSDFNPNIDDEIIITCRVKTVTGEDVEGKTVTLYKNGSSVGTSTTSELGVASWTVTCDDWGLQDFRVENTSIQVNVTGWREITIGTGRLWVNDETKTAVFYFTRTGAITSEISYSNAIPSTYRPNGYVRMKAHNGPSTLVFVTVESSGTVRITGTSQDSITLGCQITYGFGIS